MFNALTNIQHYYAPFTCYHREVEGFPGKHTMTTKQKIATIAVTVFALLATLNLLVGPVCFYGLSGYLKTRKCDDHFPPQSTPPIPVPSAPPLEYDDTLEEDQAQPGASSGSRHRPIRGGSPSQGESNSSSYSLVGLSALAGSIGYIIVRGIKDSIWPSNSRNRPHRIHRNVVPIQQGRRERVGHFHPGSEGQQRERVRRQRVAAAGRILRGRGGRPLYSTAIHERVGRDHRLHPGARGRGGGRSVTYN
ncbi:MAG: hypothetical protein WB791_10985 [Waddliaceae bacterium]